MIGERHREVKKKKTAHRKNHTSPREKKLDKVLRNEVGIIILVQENE